MKLQKVSIVIDIYIHDILNLLNLFIYIIIF